MNGTKITSKIANIEINGEMTIEFSHQMNQDVNLTNINNTWVQIYIEPYTNKKDYSIDRNSDKLNCTWEVTSYIGRQMKIQLSFESPDEISPFKEFD